tara:strand:- start:733 stop:921 length:189 start_codon:yes stop_codon:yes gene_type:complete
MPERKLAFSLTIDFFAQKDGIVETDVSVNCGKDLMPPREWLQDKLTEIAEKVGSGSGFTGLQ